jgi:hypothetical protein
MRARECVSSRLPRAGAKRGWSAEGGRAAHRGGLAASAVPDRGARHEGRSAENVWLRPAENSGRAFQKAFEAFCASAAFMPDEVRPFTGGR